MAFDPLTALSNLINKGLDKFVMDKGEKTRLKQEFEVLVLQETTKKEGIFRQFILEYEGAAKDVPKVIVILRSLIRPLFTCLVGYLDWMYFSGMTTEWGPESVSLLKAINIIVLAFWFGERALTNSGIVKLLVDKKKKPE